MDIHIVDMCDVAEVPEVNISIFRVKLCGVDEFVYICIGLC
jgi:hypothetical protein